MTDTTTYVRKSQKKSNWKRWAGNLLLFSGLLLLGGSSLARVKIILAAELQASRTLLVSEANLAAFLPLNLVGGPVAEASGEGAPLPTLQPAERGAAEPQEALPIEETYPAPLSEEAPLPGPAEPGVEEQEPGAVKSAEADPIFSFATPPMGEASLTLDKPARPEQETAGSKIYLPMVGREDPLIEIDEDSPTLDPSEGETAVSPQPAPDAGPIIRVVIPSLNIERAVIPVGLKRDSGRQLTWNTDVLFSTNNRSDLIGQASTSVNPGEGGNIILIGHNYNNGWYSPAGVFVNLAKIQPGSKIQVFTRDGGEFTYEVKLVKKVPWQKQNDAELEKHHKFLWPTENEQLTLVTCGGANIGVWSARIYVVAIPVKKNNSN